MKKDELEDIFKDSFENFEAEVSPSVWKNVQTALKGAGIGLLGKTLLNKIGANTIIAVVSSAAAVIGTVVVMNYGSKPAAKPVAKNETPTVTVQKPEPVKVEEIKEFLSDKPVVKAESEPVKQSDENKGNDQKATTGTLTIKKDKMQAVISEYSEVGVAAISATPVGGTVPLIVNLNNVGTGKVNKWNFGDGKKETSVNPVHVYDVPGVYTVILSSAGADGKTALDSIKIEVTGNSSLSLAEIARSFSPNGDNDNDVFKLEFGNMKEVSAYIFDENKKIVYVQKDFKGEWNGKDLSGKPSKEGTYFYNVNAVGLDGKKYEQNGKIKLMR